MAQQKHRKPPPPPLDGADDRKNILVRIQPHGGSGWRAERIFASFRPCRALVMLILHVTLLFCGAHFAHTTAMMKHVPYLIRDDT